MRFSTSIRHPSVLIVTLLTGMLLTLPLLAQTPDVSTVVITDTLDGSTIGLTHAGDGSGRIFTVAQDGLIQIWNGTQVLAQPFLDIASLVSNGFEQGLLGLAFHPNYSSNGYFYVNYTNTSGDTVVARYTVSAGNANVADTATRQVVLTFNQEASNHNAGDMHFGPDGYLYIASGDGGFDWCNSQDNSTLLGKILRIDVDADDFPADGNKNYAIPPGNPLIGVSGAAEEIWLMGLRNPWRFSFDRIFGEMFIGDVGEDTWEEFSYIARGVGGLNLGWPWFEGESAFNMCASPTGPFASCDSTPFSCPFTAINRTDGACSAIGGFRYRGNAYPGLRALYFFTDWCQGRLHTALRQGSSWTVYENVLNLGGTGFGEDDNGELYIVSSNTLFQITGDGLPVLNDGFENGNFSAWTNSVSP